MADITFYEKPGCINNTRQKGMLAAAGHHVTALNLLTHPWTADTLRPFFGDKPVSEWFNKAAPRIKSGEIDPTSLSGDQALALMATEPLLIRRPLMVCNGERRSGFDPEAVDAWIGLTPAHSEAGDVETCPNSHRAAPCPNP